jgi:uncharacterized OsmC-like protein
MNSEAIRTAISAATDYLTAHPDEASYTDSPAVAVLGDGLGCHVSGAAGEDLTTDMPSSVGGSGSAPSPGWFLRAAEASCLATLIAMRSAVLGAEVGRIEVTVDSESDDRGILGLDASIPAGPLAGRVLVTFRGGTAPPRLLNEIATWAFDHCPVTDAVRRAIPLELRMETE